MKLAWLNSPIGQVVRDVIEGGIAGAVAAVARRKLVGANVPPPASTPPQ